MQPYMVQQVLDINGNVVSNTEPAVKRQVISADTSKRMAAMLENAVVGRGYTKRLCVGLPGGREDRDVRRKPK